jgi:branched-chain amino acid transport system substrate-binding protein
MYRLAQNRAAEGEDEEAIQILSDFLRQHPDHENAASARNLLGELESIRRLGCLLPLTGSFKAFGERALKGVELALSRYTGENGRSSAKIIIRDTGSDPEKTAAAMDLLVQEKVLAVIGPLAAPEHAARVAQQNGVPIVTLTQKDDICGMGDYVFRNFITPKMQIEALVTHAVQTRGLERFAVLYPDEPYGRTFMSLFREEVTAQGGEVVGIEAYRLAQTDFKDSILNLIGGAGPPSAPKPVLPDIDPGEAEIPEVAGNETEIPPTVNFEALFIPDGPKKAGLIIPQLAFHDVRNVLLLGTNLWHSESLIQMARQHAQGAILTEGFYPYGRSEEVTRFVRDYREIYGEMPGFIEAVAYDSARILLDRMRIPGVRSAGEMKEALFELRDFRGVTGSTSFDRSGEARKSIYLLQIKGRKFVELDTERPAENR